MNKNNILTGTLVYDSPLSVKGNVIGKNLRIILEALHINKDNFMSLEKYLHPDVKKI
ncbi:MAG: hypothetical protein LIO65_04010 [Odoribacter sp.]|nr:hypothetical protein [Odoribacter sp.]